MSECRRLIVLKMCNCVPYNFPRNGSERVCSALQSSCIIKVKGKSCIFGFKNSCTTFCIFFLILAIFTAVEPFFNESLNFMPPLSFKENSSCYCLPRCTYYVYNIESRQAQLFTNSSSTGRFIL